MSVLVEAITVIVRNGDVDRRYPGGVAALAASAPNQTFRTDGQLAAIGFMTPSDAEVYVLSLEKVGLRFVEDGQARDIVVVDQIHGPTTACDWIEVATDLDGTKSVWLRGTPKGELASSRVLGPGHYAGPRGLRALRTAIVGRFWPKCSTSCR
jgi:hypothetical protein